MQYSLRIGGQVLIKSCHNVQGACRTQDLMGGKARKLKIEGYDHGFRFEF